ncbi:MAG TPA: ATP-binding protein [Desulfuromonadales bacterium]|nr:ATP-binding protein [Desulfuromonadales bacterium]
MARFNTFRQSLISKFSISTGIVLVLAITLFALVNLSTLKEAFFQEAMNEVESVSEILLYTTHNHMLEDNRDRVYQMMEEVSKHEKIERIRLFSMQGMVYFSTQPNENGKNLDELAARCRQCHAEGMPQAIPVLRNDRKVFQDCNRKEILSVTTEIYNEPSCYTAACHVHSKEERILGILEVQSSLQNMVAQAGSYRNNIIAFAIFLLFLTVVCLTWLTQHLVIMPVDTLLLHARKVSKMELDSQVDLDAKDEMGELADAFNEMTVKLKNSRDEYLQLTGTLETKVQERTAEIAEVHAQLVRSEKLASLGQLVAGIAHEINNPLSGILMYGTLFLNNKQLDQQLREDAAVVVRETERCAEIVKRLLEFSRTSIPDKQPRSITEIMGNTLALFEHQASMNNIEIVRDYQADLPEIAVDPTQIEQVFINMLVNASQAMPDGGTLSIGIGYDRSQDCIRTSITDTGYGIAEQDLPKIFDPFFTTKGANEEGIGGTGLGLSVSYGIIQNHGGRINVRSMVGEGTTFTIDLPVSTPLRSQLVEFEEADLNEGPYRQEI